MLPPRDESLALVQEWTTNLALVRHMLAVEAAMRAYAAKLCEDVELWGQVGLLHDFDYERWPSPPDHPTQGSKILRAKGYPEELIYAILSHADYMKEYPRVRPIEKALFACDELCGFIGACAKVQPTGLAGVTVESVRKKMKKKDFAAKVSRDDITNGAADFGVELDSHIQFLLDALKPHAAELGMAGPQPVGPESPPA